MPYKSAAQRGYMHAAEKRGDISSKVVGEFDRASVGKKLPARAAMKGKSLKGKSFSRGRR